MKKNLFITALLVMSVVLVSCTSTVGIQSWVPSKIDLTGYKNIAVKSSSVSTAGFSMNYYAYIPVKAPQDNTISIAPEVKRIPSSFTRSTLLKTSDVATNVMSSAFNSGIYNVKDSDWTDYIVSYAQNNILGKTVRSVLLSNSIDLIATSSVDDVWYEEFIKPEKVTDSEGNIKVKYYLYQRAYCEFSYLLQNVRSATVVGKNSFKLSYPSSQIFGPDYEITLIGISDADGRNFKYSSYSFYRNPGQIFSSLISSVASTVSKEISPYQKRFSISLIKDPNKSESMKTADSLVSDGQYKAALEIFNEIYEKQGLFEAGYNKAVVMFAMGEREAAEKFAYNLWSSSYNEKALSLYEKLHNLNQNQEKAINQILGTEQAVPEAVELLGF